MTPGRAVVVGRGRAGRAFGDALARIGWHATIVEGRGDTPIDCTAADLVLLCVPDSAVASVAERIDAGTALVAHVAGSLTLDVLGDRPRVGSIHPLVPIPPAPLGAQRLTGGAAFAVAARRDDDKTVLTDLVQRWHGRVLDVDDDARPLYHAAAVIASNHLVGLFGQVERVARSAGLPVGPFVELARAALDNIDEVGVAAALTGPAARDDRATMRSHLDAIDAVERPAYLAMADLCRRLAGLPPLPTTDAGTGAAPT